MKVVRGLGVLALCIVCDLALYSQAGAYLMHSSNAFAQPRIPPHRRSLSRRFAARSILGQQVIVCKDFPPTIEKKFEFLGGFERDLPALGLPEFGFVGASNVGKSSLLNSVSGSKIARTSKMPGRTQLVNLFRCSCSKGDICVFADLPGYGHANIGKDDKSRISQFLEDYCVNRPSLLGVFVLFDIRRGIRREDASLFRLLRECGREAIAVATKSDKISSTDLRTSLQRITDEYELPENQPIAFSSVTGLGTRLVWDQIREVVTAAS